MPTAEALESLHHSDQRLLRTVDSQSAGDWREPSLLPGWTRAHVVAHLALNAEGFAGALEGLTTGEQVAIYPSNDARTAGIHELAQAETPEIRERLFAATQRLRDVFGLLTAEQWEGTVNRLPEGPVWPAVDLVEARQREVEIHHADLGLDYTHADWPVDFATTLLDSSTATHDLSPDSPAFAVRATDLGRTWPVGAAAPEVSGGASALGWWLIGRGDGDGLETDGGVLPALGPWQRAR
ncbi:maleylpyruvate isomerase family mycothiol-dependent enzyme [Nocardioides marmorisolisilvae]|uniref:Maleylpyruvate isomerase family mycothiol-dependent enzyme n=1 Tax=Nocardioides marmorisolisilvae TaxID=1542737 RepID=A0A3N0DVL5_9ACTN|nr:maleylpyruvate isomerase family mycothiol-dependent enzyme [Nocardioides marmorisolisilvae]RNL79453.1 maleylpyruvate isomerase family mycothiol-dependent enzyme [Nocardioides marmorisolisilvae]